MLSTSLFAAVFEHSPIGHYLLSASPEATVLAVNDAFLKASGRRREDMVGVSLFETFPSNPDDPTDTGESDLRQSLARVAATGKPDTLPAIRYPIRVQSPNGELVFEDRFWDAVSTPIFGEDGGILCISHTTSDVTARVSAGRQAAQTQARLQALTSATADVVYRMSPDWSVMRELDGGGFLSNTEDPRPSWLADYIPADEQAIVYGAIADAIRHKRVFELEHRVRRADGSIGWTLSRAVPILGTDGEIIEWVGAASDTTERKAAEERLRELDRHKDDFLAMLAHELRNPLAPISAAAALLQHARPDEAMVRKSSQIIGRQARHMTELIDDLLDVSRVTRGLAKLDQVTLDLASVVADAVEQVTPLVQARRHRLSVRLPAGAAMVCADRKRLVQVLTNILNNAVKYTPEGGEIHLDIEADEERVRIAVGDNGIGMAPEVVARAFELFAQAERSADRASGGLGLGLALVKSLVELHGGTVSCESPGLGKGSRFMLTLPRLPAGEAPASGRDAAGEAAAPRDQLRILVVDDNEDAADTLAMLLEASGHQVLVEHASGRALARAAEARPQVCLLDLGLPDMDGAELARQLRARPETARALLVAVTGYGQESDRARTREAGFDHHLVKPIDLDRLQAVLADYAASTATGMRIR
jgi:signal transduction histidine kinase/ActR/RegA family two-component response regulator